MSFPVTIGAIEVECALLEEQAQAVARIETLVEDMHAVLLESAPVGPHIEFTIGPVSEKEA
jgi:hypothetical protein